MLQQQWIGEMAVRWAARRAAASETGSDGAAWLDGKPARAVACDATLIPVVTGGIDPGALDELVGLCLQFVGHGPHCAAGPGPVPAGGTGQPEDPVGPRPPTAEALEMLRHAIIGKTIKFLLHSSVPLDLRTFHSTDRFIPVVIVREAD